MTILRSLFQYKAWANAELLSTLKQAHHALPAEAFHLALRILNHIYVVDRIFAAHLQGISHPYTATNTTDTPELRDLQDILAQSDAWFVDYVPTLDTPTLNTALTFTFVDDGNQGVMSREAILMHLITHGSYHRGSVGRLLVEHGITPPRDIFSRFVQLPVPPVA